MLMKFWSAVERRAYREFLSVEKISDQILLLASGITLVSLFAMDVRRMFVIWLGWLLAVTLLAPLLSRGVGRVLPTRVRARLPFGRFDGPTVPNAFRSYRDLIREWRQLDGGHDV